MATATSCRSRARVLLAYSGGLDTSCILKWLIQQNYEVICYIADIGQDEDFVKAEEKAKCIGAVEVIVEDLRAQFVCEYMLPALAGGLQYEARYLLGTALARPCIAAGLVRAARARSAAYISHGATGKGNDQVRFELSIYAIWPEAKVIAPWRLPEFYERFAGRGDLLQYARRERIPLAPPPESPSAPAPPFSTDENIMHVSYESGVLEDPGEAPPKGIFKMTKDLEDTDDCPTIIDITFEKGIAAELRERSARDARGVVREPLALVLALNRLAARHGVGRLDIVENRFLGLKSRGVYETPAGTVLHAAHLDLEVFALDRELLRIKRYLQEKMSDLVYNGFWFSPEAEYVRRCLQLSQETVSGTVTVQLFKGNVTVLSRRAGTDAGTGGEGADVLYNRALVSMERGGGFAPQDATGFINIHALRLREYARVTRHNAADKQK